MMRAQDLFECAGAPRDQGLDQGLAYRGAVRDRVARSGVSVRRRRVFSLSPFTAGPVLGRGDGREVIRHYTHLAERMEGLALGADLPLESVMQLCFEKPGVLVEDALVVAASGRGGGAAVLARTLPASNEPGSRWILRRSRPEVGYASLEVTLPWLATCVAGVNEAGLAAALAPGARPAWPALLVQEALQRFGDLDGALEWCIKRPANGAGSVWIADAQGEIAGVEFDGAERRVLRPREGLAIRGGSPELQAELRKTFQELRQGADGEHDDELAAVAALAAFDPGHSVQVWLEPASRGLLVRPEPGSRAEPLALQI